MPSVFFVLLVLFVVLVMVVIIIVIAILTLVAIAGLGTDGRATCSTNTGADQLAGITTDTLADGGTTQRPHRAAKGRFILVTLVGRRRATGSAAQRSPHQRTGIPPSSLPIMVPATPPAPPPRMVLRVSEACTVVLPASKAPNRASVRSAREFISIGTPVKPD